MEHNCLPVPLTLEFDHRFVSSRTAPGPWIYLQLLSFDTPLVAVSWQLLFARTFHVYVSALTLILLTLCVWMIYVTDHLLDVRTRSCYSKRHEFAWRHRKFFCVFVAIAFLISFALVFQLARSVLVAGIALAFFMMLYFAAVHSRIGLKRYIPKEAAVALLFAAGSSIAIWSSERASTETWATLIAFAMLCLINCCMVDLRESEGNSPPPTSPHRVTRWIGCRLAARTATILIAFFTVALLNSDFHLRLAMLGSCAALLAVSCTRRHFSADSFRFVSDMSLLIPALLALL